MHPKNSVNKVLGLIQKLGLLFLSIFLSSQLPSQTFANSPPLSPTQRKKNLEKIQTLIKEVPATVLENLESNLPQGLMIYKKDELIELAKILIHEDPIAQKNDILRLEEISKNIGQLSNKTGFGQPIINVMTFCYANTLGLEILEQKKKISFSRAILKKDGIGILLVLFGGDNIGWDILEAGKKLYPGVVEPAKVKMRKPDKILIEKITHGVLEEVESGLKKVQQFLILLNQDKNLQLAFEKELKAFKELEHPKNTQLKKWITVQEEGNKFIIFLKNLDNLVNLVQLSLETLKKNP